MFNKSIIIIFIIYYITFSLSDGGKKGKKPKAFKVTRLDAIDEEKTKVKFSKKNPIGLYDNINHAVPYAQDPITQDYFEEGLQNASKKRAAVHFRRRDVGKSANILNTYRNANPERDLLMPPLYHQSKSSRVLSQKYDFIDPAYVPVAKNDDEGQLAELEEKEAKGLGGFSKFRNFFSKK